MQRFFLVALFSLLSHSIFAANLNVPMYLVEQQQTGKLAGMVNVQETKYGLLFSFQLNDVTPGIHGFHLHVNPSCDQNGMAAGGHFDPKNSQKHLGPYSDSGHLGDLPAIYVSADGNVHTSVLAPRFKHPEELKGHALMIHEGGDNYSDTPEKLGGGGGRMICGIVQ